MYLERRRRRWYALHDIPADAQKVIGRRRFVQSLDTEDRKIAERRAAVLFVRWKGEIERARTKNGDHIERDALFWKKIIETTPEQERELVTSLLADEAQETADRAAAKAGIIEVSDPRYGALPEVVAAERMVAIATGKLVRLDAHLEEYLATLGNEKKTVDMRRSTIKKFCVEFAYIADVKRKDVQKWTNKQSQDGKKPATITRALSELRGYWSYLLSIETAPEDSLPFDKLSVPKPGKNGREAERAALEPADVVKLLNAAREDEDAELADLIELGIWTGARLEELCALKVEKVHKSDYIEIADAKTAAGWRKVPIHSQLKTALARMVKDSKDGYVMSGLQPNKYGDRSNAVGKRFGRLKTALGFGPSHVYHSIRRTVATLLENAGVPEGVSADILGHDKPTMTYGLYSGGASLATKREAIERLSYA